jgi:hypothetical protein
MAYTNSPLAKVKVLSPNHSGLRNHPIDTITIHCVVGQCSARTIGEIFLPTSRQASSNYGIGFDGEIGLYVEEKNRSWCSSSASNDNRAITIEVASGTTEPYTVTEKAYEALIELCADICKRNGIKKLLWKADKSLIGQVDKQNMTVHRWFANKSCPGTYLYERHGDIARRVNAKLGVVEEVKKDEMKHEIKVGDIVTYMGTAHYPSSNSDAKVGCKPGRATVTRVHNGKHPYHLVRVAGGTSTVYGWVDADTIWELSNKVDENTFEVGDIVTFNGNIHYTSANAGKELPCTGGKAKITQIYKLGKSKHPYHLVSLDGKATVHGWVDEGTFTKA